jgi:hypothetical protein
MVMTTRLISFHMATSGTVVDRGGRASEAALTMIPFV